MLKEGYKKTDVGVIPEDWEDKELNDISSITRLAGAEYSDLWEVSTDGEIIALRGFNIGSNKIILNDVERISKSLSERLNRSKLYKNDIVFPCVGTIGKAAVIYEDDKYHINQNIAKITPDNSMDSLYLSYFLISEVVRKQILKYNTSSSQPNVLVGNLRKFKIIKPPLKEQEKIADILFTIDGQIDDTEMLIEKCQELKKGLMQRLLTKGIGHTEFKKTEVGEIPVEWEVKKLGAICNVKGGKRLPKGYQLIDEKTDNPYIRVADMYEGGIDLNNIKYVPCEAADKITNYKISKNDLFISVAGTLGIVGMIPKELDGANLTENADKLCDIKIDKEFLMRVLQSNSIQNIIESEKTTSAQPKLALARIREFFIQIPQKEEQEKISKILSAIDSEIKEYKYKKQGLEELKKGLMQQLLTGKIRTV